MKDCITIDALKDSIAKIDQSVELDDQHTSVRTKIWGISANMIHKVLKRGNAEHIESSIASLPIQNKINRALSKVQVINKEFRNFVDSISKGDDVIEHSIAMQEVIDSIKGEMDKASNLKVDISSISTNKHLANIPLARVAASIGRKVAYRKGYRFKSSKEFPMSAANIENLYYSIGVSILEDLNQDGNGAGNKGFFNIDYEGKEFTIRDYIEGHKGKKDLSFKDSTIVNGIPSVSINLYKFGINTSNTKSSKESLKYFNDRSNAEIDDTALGNIVQTLKAVNYMAQPHYIVPPNVTAEAALADSSRDDFFTSSPTYKTVSDALGSTPLRLNTSVTSFLGNLKKLSDTTSESASELIKGLVKDPILMNSLFGVSTSDDFSVDKKENIKGKNTSKTAPLDDTVDLISDLLGDMFLPLKNGRNTRLYYRNSVLNPHASKHSRFMLTSGEHTVSMKEGSEDFLDLVTGIAVSLDLDEDSTIEFAESLVNPNSRMGRNIDEALKHLNTFSKATKAKDQIRSLGWMAKEFPGVDFVSLTTALQAVNDIRTAQSTGSDIKTEFLVSADATASGGTQTFFQALGTNPEVEKLLDRLTMLGDGTSEDSLSDIYGILTEFLEDFIDNDGSKSQYKPAKAKSDEVVKGFLSDMRDLLYKDVRDLSKDPTMTFVYGQGEKGAIDILSRKMADRIIDNLNDGKIVNSLLLPLMKDNDVFKGNESAMLKDIEGLYPELVKSIQDKGIAAKMYSLLDEHVNQEYLEELQARSDSVFKLVQDRNPKDFRILPATAAVIDGVEPTYKNIKENELGVPISKMFDVSNKIGDNIVLTREQRIRQSVMDVSTIHGIDSAQLYGAISKLLVDGKLPSGVIVIHDDVRATPALVREIRSNYIAMTKKIAQEYDVHDQVLKSLVAYDPEVVNEPAYIKVRKQIDEDIVRKQEALKRFNVNTDAIIGDPKNEAVAEALAGKVVPKKKSKVISGVGTLKGNVSKDDLLSHLAKRSSIISAFLRDSENGTAASLEFSDKNEFIASDNIITVSGIDTIGTGNNIDLSTESGLSALSLIIEHEIIHSHTVGQIQKELNGKSKLSKELRYVNKAIDKLKVKFNKLDPVTSSINSYDRINYIVNETSGAASINEFLAIMANEPEVSKEVYGLIDDNSSRVKSVIDSLIKKLTILVKSLLESDFKDSNIDSEKLHNSIRSIIDTGYENRKSDTESFIKEQKTFSENLKAGPSVTQKDYVQRNYVNYLNKAIYNMVNSKIESKGADILKNSNTFLATKFPMYNDAITKIQGIYDSSPALKGLVHTVTNMNIDKLKKNKILSQFAEYKANHKDMLSSQTTRLSNLTKKLSIEESNDLYNFITKMPLHDYFIQASDLTTVEDIDKGILDLEKLLSAEDISIVESIIQRNVHGNITKRGQYNLSSYSPGSKSYEDVSKLLALKSIKEIGSDKFVKLLSNTDLINAVKDNSVANKISTLGNEGEVGISDSLIQDVYFEATQKRVITLEEMRKYDYAENTGWKVLRPPENGKLGIVYRPVIDQSFLEGAFTDIKLASSDLDVSEELKSYKEVQHTLNGAKLTLTDKEKDTLGIIRDPAESLARSAAHSILIQDSQVIRDELLEARTTHLVDDKASKDSLEEIVGLDNIDNPWFIKLNNNNYSDLPKSIKAQYKPVGKALSNVKGFNNEVSLVRKDIEHWLIGGKENSLTNNTKLQWVLRVTKNIISGSKMGMVILNPIKIAKDNVSNIAYLGAMGINPNFIQKQYRSISKEYSDYTDLRSSLIQLKLKAISNPDKYSKSMDELNSKINNMPIHNITKRGFSNSLGSDLVSRNSDTLSGMQGDIHKGLEYLLKNSNGEIGIVGTAINKLNKVGANGEDFLGWVGRQAGKTDSLEIFDKQLSNAAKTISEMKNDDDIVNYVSQFIISPGNEAVKLGAYVTDLTDIMAKETYFRFMVDKEGRTEDEATVKVLEAFPDYKENMPMAVKQLSDMGIIMFPSYWLRIQKTLYRLARDKPISIGVEMQLESLTDTEIYSILGSDLYTKSQSFGGLFHTPFDAMGWGSIFPTNIAKGIV